jgi:uncharacterized delta-60 repeat protein
MKFPIALFVTCLALCVSAETIAQSSGELDADFGLEAGLTSTPLHGAGHGDDVVAMSDGGWVVSGTMSLSGDGKVPDTTFPVLTRYSSDGSPVPGFGIDGVAVAPLSGAEPGGTVVLRDDVRLYQIASDGAQIHVFAYTLQGRPDPRYGSGGVATIEAGDFVYPVLDAVLQNGRVLIAASGREQPSAPPYYQFLLARFTASGQPDGTFGQHGRRYYQLHDGPGARNIFTAVSLLSDGKIVAAGRSAAGGNDYDMVVARFDSSGNPDTTFGADGFRVFSLLDTDYGRRVVVQSDGKIVIAGTVCAWVGVPHDGQFCVLGAARLQTNGAFDPGFGDSGKVLLAIPPIEGHPVSDGSVYGLEMDAHGRVLLFGFMSDEVTSSAAYVTRLSSSGLLDMTFGDGGFVRNFYHDAGDSSASAGLVTQLPDGTRRLVTVGTRRRTTMNTTEMVIARHIYDYAAAPRN